MFSSTSYFFKTPAGRLNATFIGTYLFLMPEDSHEIHKPIDYAPCTARIC